MHMLASLCMHKILMRARHAFTISGTRPKTFWWSDKNNFPLSEVLSVFKMIQCLSFSEMLKHPRFSECRIYCLTYFGLDTIQIMNFLSLKGCSGSIFPSSVWSLWYFSVEEVGAFKKSRNILPEDFIYFFPTRKKNFICVIEITVFMSSSEMCTKPMSFRVWL